MWIWVLEGKARDAREIGRMLGRWADEFGRTPGYLGTTAGVTDDHRFLLFARWQSEDAGNGLLARAEMQGWWEEFQRHFDGPVDFFETSDVEVHLAGGSDSAGFVQMVKASGVDRARLEEANEHFVKFAADFRPALIGAVTVWTPPDGFVEANYFTSEEEARDGEKKPPPAELREALKDLPPMAREFFDLREPFLHSPS